MASRQPGVFSGLAAAGGGLRTNQSESRLFSTLSTREGGELIAGGWVY